jgi:hypothetical protein
MFFLSKCSRPICKINNLVVFVPFMVHICGNSFLCSSIVVHLQSLFFCMVKTFFYWGQ